MTEIVTRFAPSPTGFLHIGGARTALFNWLFARHHGGKFLLRIEDTDQKRSTPAAVSAISDGLDWLGLHADQPAIFQSSARKRHVEIADQLLQLEHAYPCFLTEQELSDERELARKEKRTFYSPWRDVLPKERPTDRAFTVRLRAPQTGQMLIPDQVQGDVKFAYQDLDDLILLRADRTPTYMLAVVVDDHDMGVTHVIRGDDHLVNAARQNLIYQALDWPIPVYAHIPLIHGPDGKKLSKRHGALGIEAYRDMGYLPEALRNYLLRLGWSHGDQEFFTEQEAIEAFSLPGINRGPARLDFDKMAHVNRHFLQAAEPKELEQLVLQKIQNQNDVPTTLSAEQTKRVCALLPHIKSKANVLPDFVPLVQFSILSRPLEFDKRAKKAINAERLEYLKLLRGDLAKLPVWNEAALHEQLQNFADAHEIGFGKFGPILRAAISGGHPAPDLAAACAILGQEETIGRIDDLLLMNVSWDKANQNDDR